MPPRDPQAQSFTSLKVPCPSCGSHESTQINTRWSKSANGRIRRRVCSQCNFRYTTLETLYEGGTCKDLPLTKLPDFISKIRGTRCKKCNGEGIIRHGARIARVLKEFRMESGKTCKEVAADMGINYTVLVHMENQSKPTRQRWNAERIQKYLLACAK